MFDDWELWKRITAGDAEAFDSWYRQTAPRLQAFLRHVLLNQQAAEDVMQETFTHIWRRPQGFDPERGTLSAWVYGIARRQAGEWSRKQKPTDEFTLDPSETSYVDTALMVAEVFDRLAPEQRSLLWLREVEGQSYAELAAILEIPVGTVRSRLFAAREALRAVWHSAPQHPGGSQ